MEVLKTLHRYCESVLSGKRVAGQHVKNACQRFLNDLIRFSEPGSPYYFDEKKASVALRFPQLLVHTTGKFDGKPFLLCDWQQFIVANLWGWRRRDDGTRRFATCHIEMGRKNGKTALVAVLAWMALVLDGEARAEVYAVATKRAQSKLSWEEANRMRGRNDWLSSRFKATPSEYEIIGLLDGAKFKALGGDGGGDDGLNPYLVIFDELHEWKSEGHMKLWDKMRTGSSARSQKLFITITTAGDTKSKLWQSERKYAEQVAAGTLIDDTCFAFVCALDPDDDIFDPENWPKANPGLDTICKRSDIEELAQKARTDPRAEQQLKRYHCNLMVEPLAQGISAAVWARGSSAVPDLTGRVCHGGLDLGWRDDLASFGLVFPPDDKAKGKYYCLSWSFCCSGGARDLSKDSWPDWIKSGLLQVTPGPTTDWTAIVQLIDTLTKKYRIKSIALDGANARETGVTLAAKGHTVWEHGQTAKHYNEPIRSLIQVCTEGRFVHGDNPLLAWAISNMLTQTQQGLIRPSKEHSRDKIDPAVAIIMGYSQCLFHGIGKKETGEPRIRKV